MEDKTKLTVDEVINLIQTMDMLPEDYLLYSHSFRSDIDHVEYQVRGDNEENFESILVRYTNKSHVFLEFFFNEDLDMTLRDFLYYVFSDTILDQLFVLYMLKGV